jgi:hypothetical protein
MTEKQSNDSPTDATLAREIEDLLAVAPSPEFLARLRTQLAQESPFPKARAMGPRRRWWKFAVAAMVAAALVLVVLHRPARETPKKVVAVDVPAKPEEIVTGFFPLMENPPPFERGLLIRMTVPASAMRAVGLPVGDNHLSDPVQADLLVGQDDLARAIRFVSYRKSRD